MNRFLGVAMFLAMLFLIFMMGLTVESELRLRRLYQVWPYESKPVPPLSREAWPQDIRYIASIPFLDLLDDMTAATSAVQFEPQTGCFQGTWFSRNGQIVSGGACPNTPEELAEVRRQLGVAAW